MHEMLGDGSSALLTNRRRARPPAASVRLAGEKPSIQPGAVARSGGADVTHSRDARPRRPYSAAPTSGAIVVASESSASSPPREPMNDRPTGAPSAVPAGIVS